MYIKIVGVIILYYTHLECILSVNIDNKIYELEIILETKTECG